MMLKLYFISVMTTMYLCIRHYSEIVIFAGLNLFTTERMKKIGIEDTEQNKFKLLHQYMGLSILLAPLTLVILAFNQFNNDQEP